MFLRGGGGGSLAAGTGDLVEVEVEVAFGSREGGSAGAGGMDGFDEVFGSAGGVNVLVCIGVDTGNEVLTLAVTVAADEWGVVMWWVGFDVVVDVDVDIEAEAELGFGNGFGAGTGGGDAAGGSVLGCRGAGEEEGVVGGVVRVLGFGFGAGLGAVLGLGLRGGAGAGERGSGAGGREMDCTGGDVDDESVVFAGSSTSSSSSSHFRLCASSLRCSTGSIAGSVVGGGGAVFIPPDPERTFLFQPTTGVDGVDPAGATFQSVGLE